MLIYLPIAEMAVPAEQILLLGLVVGFMSGVFGIGGGFLTTPFLIFMGLPPAVAVGTQSAQLVAASVSSVLGHLKKGNVDVKLGGTMLIGSFIGSFIGVLIFDLLQHIGQIDIVIPILYVALLGAMGCMMFAESFTALMRKKTGEREGQPLHLKPFFQKLPYKTQFPRSKLYVSAIVPAGIGMIGGLLVSIMGIGGGFMMVPAMIYILGMPTLLVVGTSLFQIMMTTMITSVLHAMTSHTVDIVLAVMLIAGGVVGAQMGMRATKWIKGAYARIILATMLLLISFELAAQLFIEPSELYSTVVR
jgi:uncharacterized membrane protein YfcA